LIGRGGSVIKQLRDSTGATIFVPNSNDNSNRHNADKRPVRIKGESVSSLLHACWKIVHLGLNIGEPACCKVRIPSNGPNLIGKVERDSRLFAANNHTMSVYCVESFLDVEEVDTIVDNEKFANNTNAQHETVYLQLEHYPSTLVFVYGQQPETLYRALQDSTMSLWNKECLSQITKVDSKLPSGAFTVGTDNLLHPHYAQKHSEYAGITKMNHQSNWTSRAPAIAQILLESNLHLYLLQEVEAKDLFTIQKLTDRYQVIAYVHPAREAGDHVAILARRDRFVVESQNMVPFILKENPNQHYMCAATALVRDTSANRRYLVASTHFYKKKCHQPDATMLAYLEARHKDCDVIIWGGNCNDQYKHTIPSGYSCVRDGHQCTRGQKGIDWILEIPGNTGLCGCYDETIGNNWVCAIRSFWRGNHTESSRQGVVLCERIGTLLIILGDSSTTMKSRHISFIQQ